MHEQFLIGLDAGTSSLKGILVSNNGRLVSAASREYSPESGENRCELDPAIYWDSAIQVIKELISADERAGINVVALSIASQGETLICIDENGNPVRKAILWLDNRSTAEAAEISAGFGIEKIFPVTGQPEILPLLPATRILWLKKNEPEVFRKTKKYLMVEDYLLYRFTGKFVTEPAVSSSTAYFDIKNKIWWEEMLNYLEIDSGQLPEIRESGISLGRIRTEVLELTGLHPSTIVATGAYDHAAGALGAGNSREGLVSLTVGTSMAMVVTLKNPVFDISLNLPCQCHAQKDSYFLQPYGQTAGLVFRWFRDEFCSMEKQEAEQSHRNVYEFITSLAAGVPAGSGGLVMLPHFAGAGSPEYNSLARGVFEGITAEMGKPYFARAIMESVAFMIRKNIEIISGKGTHFKEIRALGGAVRSALWNQIIADVTGIPLRTLRITEAPALGAAILAGTGAGIFKNAGEGVNALVYPKDEFIPGPENKIAYDKAYDKYIRLYECLRGYWDK